jgi:hypothetical protein
MLWIFKQFTSVEQETHPEPLRGGDKKMPANPFPSLEGPGVGSYVWIFVFNCCYAIYLEYYICFDPAITVAKGATSCL